MPAKITPRRTTLELPWDCASCGAAGFPADSDQYPGEGPNPIVTCAGCGRRVCMSCAGCNIEACLKCDPRATRKSHAAEAARAKAEDESHGMTAYLTIAAIDPSSPARLRKRAAAALVERLAKLDQGHGLQWTDKRFPFASQKSSPGHRKLA